MFLLGSQFSVSESLLQPNRNIIIQITLFCFCRFGVKTRSVFQGWIVKRWRRGCFVPKKKKKKKKTVHNTPLFQVVESNLVHVRRSLFILQKLDTWQKRKAASFLFSFRFCCFFVHGLFSINIKVEVRTINDRNICERRSCMKNNGTSPTFKFVSGEERRPSEVQGVSWGWRLLGATHSSADLTWIRKWLEILAPELSELESVELELGSCCSDLDKQVSDEICRTRKRQFEIPFRL